MIFLYILVDIEIFILLIFEKQEINFFYLIGETQTMSIWITEPLDKILNPNIFITSGEQDFINKLWADSLEMSYVGDDASFWENLDKESYANLGNAKEG